jgi:NAD(P) transhydrogenase subunit alpha
LTAAGGYAREMGEERAQRQRELLTPYVAASDAVITTAAVPGRPAPLLLTASMVQTMRPGSVVVDLAAESGGNCELSRPGEEVEHYGVTVWGARDVPSSMPVHASQLYARNVVNLLLLMTDNGQVVPDFTDEVVAATCVTAPMPPQVQEGGRP